MSRFVLLRHTCPTEYQKPSHWDFMLEQEGQLQTWELRVLPLLWAQALGAPGAVEAVPAIRLPDHRLEFLEYEGPLTGGRGTVHRCDWGDYQLLRQEESIVEFFLSGKTILGNAKLQHKTPTPEPRPSGSPPPTWHLTATHPKKQASSQQHPTC